LRDCGENLLDERSLREGGYSSGAGARPLARSPFEQPESAASLWSVLIFQAWLEEQPQMGTRFGEIPDDVRMAAR
jgi:hypothetical protein